MCSREPDPRSVLPVWLFLSAAPPAYAAAWAPHTEAHREPRQAGRGGSARRTRDGRLAGLRSRETVWAVKRWSTLEVGEWNGGTAGDELLRAHLGQTGVTERWIGSGWQHPATQASQVHLCPLVRVHTTHTQTTHNHNYGNDSHNSICRVIFPLSALIGSNQTFFYDSFTNPSLTYAHPTLAYLHPHLTCARETLCKHVIPVASQCLLRFRVNAKWKASLCVISGGSSGNIRGKEGHLWRAEGL